MFLTNSMLADKGIANGSIGVITDIILHKTRGRLSHSRRNPGMLAMQMESTSYSFTQCTLKTDNRHQILQLHRASSNFQSYGAEYRRWQLPVINAFGLTIHKVQGL